MLDVVQSLHNNAAMPTLIRLANCKIELRSRDHRPAHVHVLFSDGREVLVYLADLHVLARQSVRASELSQALAWIAAHSGELIDRFEELQR